MRQHALSFSPVPLSLSPSLNLFEAREDAKSHLLSYKYRNRLYQLAIKEYRDINQLCTALYGIFHTVIYHRTSIEMLVRGDMKCWFVET
jgi:hypothetical protein